MTLLKKILFCILAVVMIFYSGCIGNDEQEEVEKEAIIEINIHMNNTLFLSNETITILMNVSNIGDGPAEIYTPMNVRIEIRNETSLIINRSRYDAIGQAFKRVINAHESFEEMINIYPRFSSLTDPDTYTIQIYGGYSDEDGLHQVQSNSIEFTIS